MEALDLKAIRKRADAYDQSGDWPAEDLEVLAAAGAMRWAVPREFGGDDLSSLELHLRYEQIATASLATALLFTQRESAVALIDSGDNAQLRAELLPRLAKNEMFATIGIAQLTTSRQGGPPVLTARRDGDGWRVSGMIPWSTGADRSRFIVAGAVVEDANNPQQILFVLSTTWGGVTVPPPLPLVALSASHTCTIQCEEALVEDRFILRGPAPNALTGRKPAVPVGQAFLAMGLCRGAIDLIREHSSALAQQAAEEFDAQLNELRAKVVAYCAPGAQIDPAEAPRLRGGCNDLAVRVTHAAVAIYKGTALLQGHPAQRLAREAMFLLVWSCPNPVIDCTVELLTAAC